MLFCWPTSLQDNLSSSKTIKSNYSDEVPKGITLALQFVTYQNSFGKFPDLLIGVSYIIRSPKITYFKLYLKIRLKRLFQLDSSINFSKFISVMTPVRTWIKFHKVFLLIKRKDNKFKKQFQAYDHIRSFSYQLK